MVKWSSKYSVGVPAVDDQHKELFKLVNELTKAVKECEELDTSFLMARLEVYSLYHFTSEEHLMKKYGFPEIEDHMREHKKFRRKILSIKGSVSMPESMQNLLLYLENWLKTHTLDSDQKYAPYLKG